MKIDGYKRSFATQLASGMSLIVHSGKLDKDGDPLCRVCTDSSYDAFHQLGWRKVSNDYVGPVGVKSVKGDCAQCPQIIAALQSENQELKSRIDAQEQAHASQYEELESKLIAVTADRNTLQSRVSELESLMNARGTSKIAATNPEQKKPTTTIGGPGKKNKPKS